MQDFEASDAVVSTDTNTTITATRMMPRLRPRCRRLPRLIPRYSNALGILPFMARLRRKTVSIKADEARPARADQLEVVPDNALNLPKKSSATIRWRATDAISL
jgi:hypothetical protein